MKIIHTSDWHLGQRFYRYDRDDEHKFFFEQLCGIVRQEKPDALLVSGDIYDNVAPVASVQNMFVNAIADFHEACPSTTIIITAGNHDSGQRIEVDKRLWKGLDVHVIGTCRHKDDDITFDPYQYILPIKDILENTIGYVVAVPYFHPSNYPVERLGIERDQRQKEFFKTMQHAVEDINTSNLPIVLMAHLAITGCDIRGHEDSVIGNMETEDVSLLGSGYDYIALGHIHKPQTINGTDGRVRYSGSPIPLSFTEDYEHSVSLVDIPNHGGEISINTIHIKYLRRVKTLPNEPADLDTALKALAELDDSDNSYVRLLLSADSYKPADAENRATEICKAKECRFCAVDQEKKVYVHKDHDMPEYNADELRFMPPMEIAMRYYENKVQQPLNEQLTTMLQIAIDKVDAEQSK